MKKIGIMSDLHLEASNIEIKNPGWDVLVLAGDISSDFSILDRFLTYQCPSDIPVVYILGNHEYEGKRKEEVVPKLKELLKDFPHVHLLQNESIVLEGIKFIGTTLWSNFEGSGINYKEEVKKWAKFNIVDFSQIFTENTTSSTPKYVCLTPDDMEKDFNKAYDFLNYELKNNPFDGPKFVVTHFAPSKKSGHAKYKDNLMNAYWVNDIPTLMGFSDYWVHGHTHSTFDYEIEGTKVVCNPRGYSKLFNLSQNENFNKELTIEIKVNSLDNNEISFKKIKP